MMDAIAELYESIKYDHPIFHRIVTACITLIIVITCFMSLPDTPMLKAMGITGIQKRISATANGLYWSTRATVSQNGNEAYTQAYGNIEGIDPKGKLVISIPDSDKWGRKTMTLANAEITDMYGAAQIVGSLRMENARFDIYAPERVVVWIRNAPLNVKLIEAGVAKPDTNPLTNIFDLAFATYYWGIAKGGNT